MKNPISKDSLAQLFSNAQTAHAFVPHVMSDDEIKALYDAMKWGPTAFNACPARFVFLRSPDAKKRLTPALSPGNVPQVESASVTVIVAHDTTFYEFLPELFPAYDAKPIFESNPAAAADAAFRNGTLQGAYLIMAARALGYDCGPMSGFDAAKVNAEFFANGRYQANFLLNIGVADPKGVYPRNKRLDFGVAAQIL
jgi:3-hydroxypropanoate dehydrogenase